VAVPTSHQHAGLMKATVGLILSWLLFLFMQLLSAMEREQTAPRPVAEDYGPYDRIIEGKFPRSQIQLVLLEHRAVSWPH
jgi:hypothetical protein